MVQEKTETPEAFDEFDFVHRGDPNIKVALVALQKNLSALGRPHGSRLQSWPIEYAEKRGIKGERGVVMPAFGRLLNAYKWLQVYESMNQPSKTELPF